MHVVCMYKGWALSALAPRPTVVYYNACYLWQVILILGYPFRTYANMCKDILYMRVDAT
jgi:hypothetical protein